MDPTILLYTILTTVLSAVIVEETRDLRYVPLLAAGGLALVGGLLCVTDLGLNAEPVATITKSFLAVFAILAGVVFFRDFRAVNKVCREANTCHGKTADLLKTSMFLLSSSKALNEKTMQNETEANIAVKLTTDSVEGLQHG